MNSAFEKGRPIRIRSFSSLELPVVFSTVKAGFASPAESFCEERLDLNKLAISNSTATYFLKVSGTSMSGVGIFPGDYLIVDRSLQARKGDIVVASISENFTVKRFSYEGSRPILLPENPEFDPIRPRPGEEIVIFGVVTGVFRKIK